MRTRVIIESPYAGDLERNREYTKRCMIDSICRDEAPFASHMLYTQILDDTNPIERLTGIECGFAWREGVLTVVYEDYGISEGMQQGIDDAFFQGSDIAFRKIGVN